MRAPCLRQRNARRSTCLGTLGKLAAVAIAAAAATGCVTRTADHDGVRPPLWELEPDVLVKNRSGKEGKGIFVRFLRAGGRVECSGWLFKKQTTHVYARITRGREGEPLVGRLVSAKVVYREGLLEGVAVHNSAKRASSVETYETLSVGFNPGFECGCVHVTATAPVATGRTLVVSGEVCPEEE